MDEYPTTDAVFVGVSRRGAMDEPPTFADACENAWAQATERGYRKIRIVEIELTGSNPIDMYSVVAVAGGA